MIVEAVDEVRSRPNCDEQNESRSRVVRARWGMEAAWR
jgi:hypothetical protein